MGSGILIMAFQRLRATWLILSSVFITVLLGVVLLAAGPIYADAAYIAGVQRRLHDAPARTANLVVSVRTDGEQYAAANQLATQQLERALAPETGSIVRSGTSDPFDFPGAERDGSIAVFQFIESIESHATLTYGRWPEAVGEPYETAVLESTARKLGLHVGDQLVLENRLVEEHRPSIVISGIFRHDDPTAAFWLEDPLWLEGVVYGESVTTFGPFVVTRATFFEELTPRPVSVSWQGFPNFDRLTVARVPILARDVARLEARLNRAWPGEQEYSVETELDDQLTAAERALLATRSGVITLMIQLAILAGYALTLAIGLLLEQRRGEMHLLRARGASVRQVTALAAVEGLMLSAPICLLAPWIAAYSLQLLNHVGPLSRIGLTLQPRVTALAYLFTALAGAGSLLLLTVPVALAARGTLSDRPVRQRRQSRSLIQRGRVDLVLLALAIIGLFQLRRYGVPITETVQGRLAVDPLLVAAPALGLLAGALVALRLMPLLARLAEQLAARGQVPVAALGAWQLARRPERYARSALLLMLALGIGFFAVAYSRTWEKSQIDQANYQVGADIRLRPDPRPDALPRQHLMASYFDLPGVSAVMPLERQTTELIRSLPLAVVLVVDGAEAARVVRLREDLGGSSFSMLMDDLAGRRPEVAAIPIPGEPERIALDLRAEFEPLMTADEDQDEPENVPGGTTIVEVALQTTPAAGPCADPRTLSPDVPAGDLSTPLRPAIVLRDRYGQLQRFTFDALTSNGEQERLVLPLTRGLADGTQSGPAYPLEIVAIEFGATIPPLVERCGTVALDALLVSSQDDGDDWTTMPLDLSPTSWELAHTAVPEGARLTPAWVEASRSTEFGTLRVQFGTGSVKRNINGVFPAGLQVSFALRPAGDPVDALLPVIVSPALLDQLALREGDIFPLRLGVNEHQAQIAGVLAHFPTVAPETELMLVLDIQTLAALQLATPGAALPVPDEYWLAADLERSLDIAGSLRAAPYSSSEVESRLERARSLRGDPVALGMIGALSLGFVAAALFAAIGYSSSAVVSARERFAEFALLRALGLSPRQLTGWLLLEHGLLVGAGLLGGTLLGLTLVWLVLPLISVTQEATRVFPAVVITIPWKTIAALQLGMAGVLVVMSASFAFILRRVGLGQVLRAGEE